jgi:hypothetical protein
MSAASAAASASAPLHTTRPRVRVIFAGLMLVLLLAALDQTIVATALPTIGGDLGGLNRISWVTSAFLLARDVIVSGQLITRRGRYKVFPIIGTALMSVGLAPPSACSSCWRPWPASCRASRPRATGRGRQHLDSRRQCAQAPREGQGGSRPLQAWVLRTRRGQCHSWSSAERCRCGRVSCQIVPGLRLTRRASSR